MENENESVQEEVVEQEEQTSEETNEEEANEETQEEESDEVTLSKADFKKLNYKAKAYDASKNQQNGQVKKVSVQTDTIPSERLDRLELKADGYSADEIDAIMDLGGIKVLNKPLVQKAIKAMRTEQKSNDAKVVPNSKAPIYKKYNQEDLNKMSASEMEKVLQS